jgi:magnesium transporter
MEERHYIIDKGRLKEIPNHKDLGNRTNRRWQNWYDIQSPNREDLAEALERLDPHPIIMDLALNPENSPNAIYYGQDLLMEVPIVSNTTTLEICYFTIIWREGTLITIHSFPYFEDLVTTLKRPDTTHLEDTINILYVLFDRILDQQVKLEIAHRDQMVSQASQMADGTVEVTANDLAKLRQMMERIVMLAESYMFLTEGMNTTDIPGLRREERKAYIRDLIATAEIAHASASQMEKRLNSLYAQFQMIRSEDSEKRLRFLTILSAVNLPLMLITGIYGMNMAWLPVAEQENGFYIVLAFMGIVLLGELWFFKAKGWFD